MRASLVDTSRYQGIIDGAKIKAAGFCGILARCTIGIAEDGSSVGKGLQYYLNSQKQARDNGLVFGAYHVLWPSNQQPIREADLFLAKSGLIDFSVLDVELLKGLSLSQVQSQSRSWLERVGGVSGQKPLVYTGSWFWKQAAGWENEYDLIEAEYTQTIPVGGVDRSLQPEDQFPKVIGWDQATFWQWTSSGKPAGVQSKSLDYDVFLDGDETALRAYLGLGKPPLTLEEKVEILWDAHPELHP